VGQVQGQDECRKGSGLREVRLLYGLLGGSTLEGKWVRCRVRTDAKKEAVCERAKTAKGVNDKAWGGEEC
jgi:hypothetical protein